MKRDPLGSSPMHIQKRGYPKGGKLSSNPGGIFNGTVPSGISPAYAVPVARDSVAILAKNSLLIGRRLSTLLPEYKYLLFVAEPFDTQGFDIDPSSSRDICISPNLIRTQRKRTNLQVFSLHL